MLNMSRKGRAFDRSDMSAKDGTEKRITSNCAAAQLLKLALDTGDVEKSVTALALKRSRTDLGSALQSYTTKSIKEFLNNYRRKLGGS